MLNLTVEAFSLTIVPLEIVSPVAVVILWLCTVYSVPKYGSFTKMYGCVSWIKAY
jgi:hypothetical protein